MINSAKSRAAYRNSGNADPGWRDRKAAVPPSGLRTAKWRVKTNPPYQPLSPRQRQQGGFVAGLAGRLLYDQGHRGDVVVADDPDHVHDAPFSEFGECRLEGGVVDVLVAIKLGAEIVERGLVLLHALRPCPGAEVDENLTVEAPLDGQRIVRPPFIGLRPLPGRDHDGKFAEPGRQRTVEAHVIAHLQQQEAEPRTARIRVERTGVEGTAARRCRQHGRHLLLFRRQLVEAKFGKALLRLRGATQETGNCGAACDAPKRMNEMHHLGYLHRLCCHRPMSVTVRSRTEYTTKSGD